MKNKVFISIGALFLPLIITLATCSFILWSPNIQTTQVLFYPGLLLGTLIGAGCLSLLGFKSIYKKIAAITLYIPIMVSLVWFVVFPWFHAAGSSNV